MAARTPTANSPRQQKAIQQQRAKLSSASGRSGSGSRQHYHRSSPRSSNHHHYYNPSNHQRQPVQPEARSLTTDTSFHSESFYPDWAAHPHHIRLPYPSPESSFDQLWFAASLRSLCVYAQQSREPNDIMPCAYTACYRIYWKQQKPVAAMCIARRKLATACS